MRKAWLIVAAVSMGACSPERPAETASPSGPGTWVSIDAFSPDVQEAARYAVQTFAVQNKQRVLYQDVTQARQHVLAGLQFEMALQVTLEGTHRRAQALVWRQADGVYLLQSWAWLD
jgi:hypothetical protein